MANSDEFFNLATGEHVPYPLDPAPFERHVSVQHKPREGVVRPLCRPQGSCLLIPPG